MTREEKVDQAIEEAYEVLCEMVVEQIEDFMAEVEYQYIDFTDESLEFINKEIEKDENSEVIYDVMEPAIRRLLKITRQALIYDNF